MKTQIICKSRLEVLHILLKLEKHNISYVENEDGIVADITPEKAWCISLI